MQDYTYIPLKEVDAMKSYVFKVVFEKGKWPDEPEEKTIWHAYIPALSGAHAWGNTEQEAYENLKSAVDLIIAEPSPFVRTSEELIGTFVRLG